MIYSYPLNWPPGYDRTPNPGFGGFQVSLPEAEKDLALELDRLGATNDHLSTDNQLMRSGRPKNDFGQASAAVVLHFIRDGQELTIPCDKFADLRSNVRAIGLTLEAIRRMERYGTSQMMDRALSGFAALPAGASAPIPKRPWHEVLGVSPEASPELVEAAYRVALKKAHPDVGGSETAFKEVQNAYEEATR